MLRYSPLAVASRTNLKMAVCKGYRGNEYNFIQDPSDSLICQICYSVASCPQQHSECGKLFCETCVEDYRAKNDQGTCPNCRQEFFTKIFSDYRGGQDVKALKVRCDNLKNGCQWVGQLGAVDKHHKTCGYAIVPCENEGCDCTNLQRRDLNQHMWNECLKRRYKCPHCEEEGHYDVQTTSHLDVCEMIVVYCPNDRCNEPVPRKTLASHRSECDFEPIPCKFARFGCEEQRIRKEMKEHEEDAVCHLKSTQEKVLELMEIVERQGKFIEEQAEPISMLSKHVCTIKQPFTFKVSDIQLLLDLKTPFHSPPFYSIERKHRIVVNIDIQELTPTPEVRVYVIIDKERGLIWFKGTITVMLLNQEQDNYHREYRHTVDYDDQCKRDIPLNETTKSFSQLAKYCVDNTMTFRATIEEDSCKSWLV